MSLSLSSANTYSSTAQNIALCAAGGGRPKTIPTLTLFRRYSQRRRRGFPTRSSLTRSLSDTFSDVNDDERKRKRAVLKEKLIESCRGTYRGAIGFSNDREREDIRNAKEALETFGAEEKEEEKDWMRNRVNGRWKLIYTTALDVTGLLVFSVPPPPLPFFPPPPIVVGDIFQEFKTDAKEIVNEIRASVPWVLEEKDGVILRVNATYKEVDDSSNNSKKALELVFQEAVVSDVRISELTETLLAPAILPRSELNQRALLFLRDFEVRFPLFGRAARAMGGSDENGVSGAAVGRYEFSYCDEDVLIGKATGSQGIFIFTKDHQSQM